MAQEQRRLAAILVADVVGYSRLVGNDEAGTLTKLSALKHDVIEPTIGKHAGRLFKSVGDGFLVEFASAVQAVTAARAIQQANASGPLPLRIGIHVGDVVVQGDDLMGDGVNMAARIEGVAEAGGIAISRQVRDQVRDKLDVELVDKGEVTLKNIARPMRVFTVGGVKVQAGVLALPDKPSIAVLPFTNMSGDPEQEYFSDGIAEDIITMLSHCRSLFVIARNSSFAYKGRSVDVKQVSRELGVRYLMEGSVRRGGNRVRVSAQLIDAETGNHLWAERYDRDLSDVFAVQDEITEAVAIAIEPAVAEMERQRAVRRPPESLHAWEAYQRGLWHIAHLSAAEHEKAMNSFRHAIELDSNFAAVYSSLALATMLEAPLYQNRSIDEGVREAVALAQRAISLDPTDALGHSCLGQALTLQGDYEGGLAEARRALAINPNAAFGHGCLGLVLLWSGHPREAIDAVRQGLRHDPYDPVRFIRLSHIGVGHYLLREYEAAVEMMKETIRFYPDHPWAHRWLAAAQGQLGRIGEARQALKKAIAIAPKSFEVFVRHRVPWMRPEDYGHMLEGLRKAGWADVIK